MFSNIPVMQPLTRKRVLAIFDLEWHGSLLQESGCSCNARMCIQTLAAKSFGDVDYGEVIVPDESSSYCTLTHIVHNLLPYLSSNNTGFSR